MKKTIFLLGAVLVLSGCSLTAKKETPPPTNPVVNKEPETSKEEEKKEEAPVVPDFSAEENEFKSEKYGFTLRYPKNFPFEQSENDLTKLNPGDEPIAFSLSFAFDLLSGNFDSGVIVEVEKMTEEVKGNPLNAPAGTPYTSKEELNLNGEKAMKYTKDPFGELYVLSRGDYRYRLYYFGQDPEVVKIFPTMVKSFSFVK